MGTPRLHHDLLSLDELKTLLRFDPTSGEFYRQFPIRNNLRNSPAGTIRPDGYRQIHAGRKLYFAHQLAFLFTHNRWPNGRLDHINQNKSDNRPGNLREATGSQNNANTLARKKNKLGLKGVRVKENGSFQARICHGYITQHIGSFKTAEEAAKAYDQKALELFGEFARLQLP